MDSATILETRVIGAVGEANEIFGGKGCRKGSHRVPIVLIPTRRCCCPYITVPSGMYALVQDAGRDTDYGNIAVWPSGFHFASPFPCWQRRISHLVTQQAIVFDTPIQGCKTMDDVTVTIDIAVAFRIMGDESKGEDPILVREFVQKLGPAELARQLKDAQDERVRALARSVKHTEVYSLRSRGSHMGESESHDLREDSSKVPESKIDAAGDGIEMKTVDSVDRLPDADNLQHIKVNKKVMGVTEDMKRKLNIQFNRYGVQIIDVAIQRVSLPPQFADQMEKRTTYGASIEEQKQKQMKDMQRVRQREEIETLMQKYEEEQSLERESGKRMQSKVQQKLDNVNAETKKQVATIQEERKAAVAGIEANMELKVQELKSQAKQIIKQIDAEAQAEKDKMIADCDAYVWLKQSEAKLVESETAAQSKKVVADAEGNAAVPLTKKRAFELQKAQIAMYSALADNQNVVITGKNAGQGMMADLVMSQKQSNILLNVKSGN